MQRTSTLWYSAEYSTFSISDEAGNYQLAVDGYSGDSGDSLRNSFSASGQMFSTYDRDNDQCGGYNCAAGDGGAWWFACCARGNINYDSNAAWGDDNHPAADVTTSHVLVRIN